MKTFNPSRPAGSIPRPPLAKHRRTVAARPGALLIRTFWTLYPHPCFFTETVRTLVLALFWWWVLLTSSSVVVGHGDSMSAATALSLGSSTSGAIDWAGDEDWFVVQVTSSGALTAYTTGATDTYGYLVDSAGSTLSSNDDDPYPNFRVSSSVTAGSYYIRVRHYSSSGTGDYTLYTSFTSSPSNNSSTTTPSGGDAGNSISSAATLSVGSAASDQIDYAGDEDFFRLQIGSSGTLTAYSTGNTDTYGYLLDSAGAALTYNDDNPYPNFRFSYSISAGTYYIRVRHYSSSGTGPYSVYTEFSGAVSGSNSTTGSVSLSDALDNTALAWSSAGNASWFGQTSIAYAGGDAAQSGSISHSSSSSLDTTITGPATLSFIWSVSSESGYDYLRFLINGVQQNAISGSSGWSFQTYNLPSGSHSVSWNYTTDGSVLSGSNAGWVDDVQISSTTTSPPPASETPDLIFRHPQQGLNAIWFMNGSQLQQSEFLLPDLTPDLDWNIVGAGDFNSDGKKDLVWQHRSTGMIGVWFMNGRAMTTTGVTNPDRASDLGWRIVGVADFNWDNKPDLLWQHQATTQIAIWYMDGLNLTSALLTSPSSPSDYGWQIVGTGDFNRDGRTDLVWQHANWDYVAVWYMNGALFTGSTYTSPYSPYDLNWDIVDTGDFNNDGYPDFLWQHRSYGLIAIWFMNNAVMTSSTYTSPSGPNPANWQVQTVADFDYSTALLTDTDSDLMPDAWEQQYFGTLSQSAYSDYDNDGVSNVQEYRDGSNPIIPRVYVRIGRPRSGSHFP